MLGVPLILFIYYASLLSKGVSRDLPITLLDLDKSELSREFARMLDATPTMHIAYEVSDELQGQRTIKRGESFALVIIPKDFQKNVQKGLLPNLTCYYNGQYLLPAGLILRDFQTTATIFAAGAKVLTLQNGGLMPEQAAAAVLPVGTDSHVLYNPYTSYEIYLNIAFMPMAFQIVIMVVSVYVFGSVLKYRRGKELYEQGNGNIFVIMFGKILPYTIIFFIIGFFMNCLLYYKIGVPLQGSFVVINLFFLSFILVCQGIAFFLASVMSSLRTALSIGGSYSALAFSFAGYTFPLEGMSPFIRALNYIFPFHSYMRFTVDYAIRGLAFNSSQQGYVITLAVFACIGMIGIPFYSKRLQKGGYDV